MSDISPERVVAVRTAEHGLQVATWGAGPSSAGPVPEGRQPSVRASTSSVSRAAPEVKPQTPATRF
jgi:hypothetical protein